MLFLSKQKKIETQLAQYRQKVSLCVTGFHDAIQRYCQSSDRDQLERDFLKVHKDESLADDIRREIEVLMYSKSIFPESRGDIFSLLEALDKADDRATQAYGVTEFEWKEALQRDEKNNAYLWEEVVILAQPLASKSSRIKKMIELKAH